MRQHISGFLIFLGGRQALFSAGVPAAAESPIAEAVLHEPSFTAMGCSGFGYVFVTPLSLPAQPGHHQDS
jgi:hypothetical protein